MSAGTPTLLDGDHSSRHSQDDSSIEPREFSLEGEEDLDRLAVVREVLPATLRWLYILRISLYTAAALLAVVKVIFAPTVSAFILDLLTDSPAARHLLENWIHALTLDRRRPSCRRAFARDRDVLHSSPAARSGRQNCRQRGR